MDKPAGHYSVFRVPFQIDAEGDCTRCGLKIEPDEDTLEPHECPPGFTEPAMSRSEGLKRYNGVEQDDEGAYVYYDEHIAALRRAKAEVWRAVRVARCELEKYQRQREGETNASRRDMLGGAMLACSNILAALQKGRT